MERNVKLALGEGLACPGGAARAGGRLGDKGPLCPTSASLQASRREDQPKGRPVSLPTRSPRRRVKASAGRKVPA